MFYELYQMHQKTLSDSDLLISNFEINKSTGVGAFLASLRDSIYSLPLENWQVIKIREVHKFLIQIDHSSFFR